MKILQMIPTLASGGAERFVVSLSNELAEMGYDVTICTLYDNANVDFNKQYIKNNISYHSLQIKGKNYGYILKHTYAFISQIHPDIIHCHLGILQYIFPICFIKPEIKIYHTIHNIAEHASGNSKWHAKLYRYLYKKNKIKPITISEECHLSYTTFYHLKNDIIIENGVVPTTPTKLIKQTEIEINSYKHNPTTPVFIHIGRYHEAKNQEMLINIFNDLDEQHIDFCLIIIGRGFDKDKGKDLQKIACEKIHFLGEKNNVGDYLLCSDYFCLTSIYEGLPLSLLEAMSAGVVPICTPAGGIVNVLHNNQVGFLSSDFSFDSYKKTLNIALSQKIEKDTIISIYKKSYSIHTCAKKYIQLWEEERNKNK